MGVGKVLIELRDEDHMIRAVQCESFCRYGQPPKWQWFIDKMKSVNGVDAGNSASCRCKKECGTTTVNMHDVRLHRL